MERDVVPLNLKQSRKQWKHVLPNYYPLKCFQFDIEKLQGELRFIEDKFENVLKANKALCLNNSKLVESVYDHYEQISLTTYRGVQSDLCSLSTCLEKSQNAGTEKFLSKKEQYKLKISKRFDIPEMDERNYDQATPFYEESFIKKCVDSFPSRSMRVRLVKLNPGKTVDWHIDYDPSFATRIIVPLITNPKVINKTKRKGHVEACHIPANGTSWFLNTGYSHYVENLGSSPRVILMFSLYSNADFLEKISQSWLSGNTALESLK